MGFNGDAVELAQLVRTEGRHAGLFALFLDVRNAAAATLPREGTGAEAGVRWWA